MEQIYDMIKQWRRPRRIHRCPVRCPCRAFHAGAGKALRRRAKLALTEQIDNYPGFEGGIDGFTLGERIAERRALRCGDGTWRRCAR